MNSDELIPTTLLQEIIVEILLKLPVESLLRCKSVCKEWYSLISDQNFIKSHYTLSSTNNINYEHHRLICIKYERNDLYSCPLYDVLFHKSANNVLLLENPIQQTQGFRIVGSCKGLVCILVKDDVDDYNLFIYNPSTRIWNGLPFGSGYVDPKYYSFGYDESTDDYGDPKYYSFGYDESTDDYKIVEMCTTVEILDLYASTETIEEVNIYSLKTGKWKNLGDFSYRDPLIGSGIFSNGALHWVAYDLLDSPYTQRIVSLDLAKETYGEVLQPEYDEGDTDLALGVLGEWLCVLCTYLNDHVPDVWVMKVYGVKDSWTKLASIQDPAHYWTSQRSVPLCISNDGKILFQLSNRFVIYDSKDNYVSHIQDFLFSQACIVVESLVSPFPPLCLADNSDDEN